MKAVISTKKNIKTIFIKALLFDVHLKFKKSIPQNKKSNISIEFCMAYSISNEYSWKYIDAIVFRETKKANIGYK